MKESFMKYDRKNPPAGVGPDGVFTGGGGKAYYIQHEDILYTGGENCFVNTELFDALTAGEHPTIWFDGTKCEPDYGHVLITSFVFNEEGCISLRWVYRGSNDMSFAQATLFRTQDDWLKYARDNELL